MQQYIMTIHTRTKNAFVVCTVPSEVYKTWEKETSTPSLVWDIDQKLLVTLAALAAALFPLQVFDPL